MNINDNDDNNDNAKGGNHSNGTLVGQQYGQPCNRHPGRGPGVGRVKASAGICAGIRGGGVGGEYDGERLFDNNRDDNNYDNDDKYNNAEDGKGLRGGADDGGESDYDCCNIVCGPSFGNVGHMTSIVGPHASAAVINDTTMIAATLGGRHAPPPPVRPVPPDANRCCQCCRPRSMPAAQGRSGCGHMHGGGGGVWRHCTCLAGSDPPQGGQRGEEEQHDIGGITLQSTSG